MYRRIELFGGPGSGKTTLSHRLTYELKANGYVVEHIPELAKSWVFRKTQISDFDQLYLFAHQLMAEDLVLRQSPKHLIVTDAPPGICLMYGVAYKAPGIIHLWDLLEEFDKKYPPLKLFIDRPQNVPYDGNERFEHESMAHKIHTEFWEMLEEKEYIPRFPADSDEALYYVLNKLEEFNK